MYADTSPACVSIMGRAVNDPPPLTLFFKGSGRSFISEAMLSSEITFAALSSKRECK